MMIIHSTLSAPVDRVYFPVLWMLSLIDLIFQMKSKGSLLENYLLLGEGLVILFNSGFK